MSDIIETFAVEDWCGPFGTDLTERAVTALEAGKLILLPRLAFPFDDREGGLLSRDCTNGKSKNISYDPCSGGHAKGSGFQGEDLRRLDTVMARYARRSRELVGALFPRYAPFLEQARTSFRPIRVEGRTTSPRKDDTRLHADAFPSSPTQGRRILRVFSNVNPEGLPRLWHVGEPFHAYARRFLPGIHRPWPGSSWLLEQLGITKGQRSAYDDLMLQLHDRGKLDAEYQRTAPFTRVELPSGSTWIVYSDQVVHAALAGQYLLEQTFHLPIDAMMNAETAPLRVLERLCGRRLV
jgi:hypothetical protein